MHYCRTGRVNRSAEEQVLGVGPLDAARNEASSTGVLVLLTILLLLSVLALAVARGESLRATDAVTAANEVNVTILQARVAVDEDRMDRRRELFQRLQELTADNPKQQARVDELLAHEDADLRDLRIRLDVMSGEQEALVAVREANARSKRALLQFTILLCTALSVAFSGAAIFMVRKARRDLGQQTAMLGSIVDSIGDGVVAVDREGKCVIVNSAFRHMFGVGFGQGNISINEALQHGMRREDGSPLGFDEGPFGRALKGEALDNFGVSLNTEPRTWLSATSRPVRDARGEIESVVVVLRDVTQERNDRELLMLQSAELQVQSLSDELTGLCNRRGFMVLGNQYARTAARQKRPYAIVFSDLDGLKAINDTHGHEAGDAAIARMAAALRATLREADIIARLGGDEFVALVDGADETSIQQVITRLREEMDRDAERHATPYRLHTSIGVAFQDAEHAQTIEQLLTLADERMYAEKKTTKETRTARAHEAETREAEKREAAIREAKLKEVRARRQSLVHAPPRPSPRSKS